MIINWGDNTASKATPERRKMMLQLMDWGTDEKKWNRNDADTAWCMTSYDERM